MNLAVRLPYEIEKRLTDEWPDLERRALEGFLVEAYRRKMLTSHEIGSILGFESRWDAIGFLSERGVYPNLDLEDLEEDRLAFENLPRE